MLLETLAVTGSYPRAISTGKVISVPLPTTALIVPAATPAAKMASASSGAKEAGRLGRVHRASLPLGLEEVRRLAGEVAQNEPALDALVNNAGIGTEVPGGGERQVSEDGHELRFAVNYLSGYLLTRSLLPLLERSAPARIVNVSSAGQM